MTSKVLSSARPPSPALSPNYTQNEEVNAQRQLLLPLLLLELTVLDGTTRNLPGFGDCREETWHSFV